MLLGKGGCRAKTEAQKKGKRGDNYGLTQVQDLSDVRGFTKELWALRNVALFT